MWCFREEDYRGKAPFLSLFIKGHSVEIDLDHLRSCLSDFPSAKPLFPAPFPYGTLCKKVIVHSLCLRKGEHIYISYLKLF
jgi:hypothetical protein